MNKEYEIYYEAFDIEDAVRRREFIREKCADDEEIFERILKLFPEEEIESDVYGKYKIERELGRGGMGVVYLASFSESFGKEVFRKEVALKTINPVQRLDARSIRAFLQEIKTLAELDHPNIARFLDIGTSEKGKPFLVMEYVEGLSLTDYCNSKKFSVAERLAFFSKILDAVEYSHRRGFIHCDLKPNNILVGSDGVPKVIDFGIASKYGSFISDKDTKTNFFRHSFTLDYASPEQIKGEKKLTEKTDIYSLGVVLYELLTGKLPIEFENDLPFHKLITTAENHYPPPLKKSLVTVSDEDEIRRLANERDRRTVSELKADLSGDLDEIVQKAINKKPERRYENIKSFEKEIRNFLDEESSAAQIKRAFGALGKKSLRRVRRFPLKWTAAVLLAVAILMIAALQNPTVRTIPYYLQIKFAADSRKIPLSNSQKQNLDGAIGRLRESLSKNFSEAFTELADRKFSDKYNSWGLADLIVSLAGANFPLEAAPLDALIENLAFEQECWKEEKIACKTAVSGWIFWAKSRLNKPVSAKQLDFLARQQNAEGWFPAYPYPENPNNAGTYPTAIVILGLTEQLRLNLLPVQEREKAKNMIEKGTLWLLESRRKEDRKHFWIDCPNAPVSAQSSSDGLDALVVFTLHRVAESKAVSAPNFNTELKVIDSRWLDRIGAIAPDLADETGCQCGTIAENEIILDRTKHSTVPWSIMATAAAYESGTDRQKAVAAKWLEELPLAEEFDGFYFIAAEYLIALTDLREKTR